VVVLDRWPSAPTSPGSDAFHLVCPPDLRQRLFLLAQGDTEVAGEGHETIEVAPTLLLCANGSLNVVDDAYRRRSVVLDTTVLRSQLGHLHEAVRQITAGALPRLDLAHLALPAKEVPDELRNELLDVLRSGLTETGIGMLDERAVEHLALGRAALGASDLRQAVMATAADYLSCARTVGETLPGVPATVVAVLGGSGTLLPAPVAAEIELASQHVERRSKERADANLVKARAAYSEQLRQAELAIRYVPVPLKPEAKGRRAALRYWATKVANQRTPEGLREVYALAEPDRLAAVELADEVQTGREEEERRKTPERVERRNQRAVEAQIARTAEQAKRTDAQRRRQNNTALARYGAALQRLYDRSRPKPGEDALGSRIELGCVERIDRTETIQLPPGIFEARRARKRGEQLVPKTAQRIVTVYGDRAGGEYRASELNKVGTAAFCQAIEASAAFYGISLRTRRTTLVRSV
jgi:hypothetical protein